MRRLARLLTRFLAFGLLKVARLFDQTGRSLACAAFTPNELDALSVAEWESFAERPPVADDQLFGWERELFASQIRPGDSILVVGAGTGRDVLALLDASHAVTALDIAPRALDTLSQRARERGLRVTAVHASLIRADLKSATFDVILFSWFCYGYTRGRAVRAATLARGVTALSPGGRILLSYQPRGELASREPLASRFGRVAARLLGGFEIEPGDEFTIGGTASRPSVFFTHPFGPAEIELEAREAGLRVLKHTQPAPGVGVLVLSTALEGSG